MPVRIPAMELLTFKRLPRARLACAALMMLTTALVTAQPGLGSPVLG